MAPNPLKVAAGVATTGGVGYLALRRPWLRLGATSEEVRRTLPGDEVIPDAMLQATRATTIDAPVESVWPWLVQMGHDRAGWYSFDRLDNAGQPSATRIIPDLQHLAVGDAISDATGPFSFTVSRLDPRRALVLRATIHPVTGRPVDPAEVDPDVRGYPQSFLDLSWGFTLEPKTEARTRLLIRVRYRHQRSPWVRAMVHGYEVVNTVFTRRMIQGLVARCEGVAAN